MKLTQELVKQLFDYHPDGYLMWKIKPKNQTIEIGDRAGYIEYTKTKPRYRVTVNNSAYLVSRIIFLYHKGYLPPEVDHEDRNPLNDKIENLRAATRAQNMGNTRSRKNSTSKYLGVYLKCGKLWCAQIRAQGKQRYLGSHKTEELAALAYNREAVRFHGEFANLNIITGL